ncbi:hypothetical protein IEO21_06711 [Rhodonia placenta]|uniref:Uncharacterized protein n=1 Tax=Rhodonia placenta TaxID=104341 RepID=A0A8H7NZG7_9APHY|nr:hypothetical protein IEO21_06711 [Postia placenta]
MICLVIYKSVQQVPFACVGAKDLSSQFVQTLYEHTLVAHWSAALHISLPPRSSTTFIGLTSRSPLQCAQGSAVLLRVLEMGAGTVLPSIVIARLYDRVQRKTYNKMEYPGAVALCPQCIELSHMSGFDVLIAADTLWDPELHSMFIQTLCMALRCPDARIYLVAGLHMGRYAIQAFWGTLTGAGFDVEEATERDVAGSGRRAWDHERADRETDSVEVITRPDNMCYLRYIKYIEDTSQMSRRAC